MAGNECYCGNWKNWNARACWTCGNDARRRALTGVPHTAERRARNSASHRRLHAAGYESFDLGGFTRGQPAWNRKSIGSTRVGNGHIQIKCPDGRWRYRARVMWEAAHGPIPPGHLIHHINHDPFDDRLDNFQLVTRREHMRGHLPSDEARRRGAKGLATRYGHKPAWT